MNIRVSDIEAAYAEWSAYGAPNFSPTEKTFTTMVASCIKKVKSGLSLKLYYLLTSAAKF